MVTIATVKLIFQKAVIKLICNTVKMEFSKSFQERGRPQLTIRLFKSLAGVPSMILKLNLRTPKPNAEDL